MERRTRSRQGARKRVRASSRGAAKPAPDAARRRPGRPPREPAIGRQRLLDSARQALRTQDFESLRITDVVRRAGMSSKSFYQHFASKEDILVALIEQTGRELLEEIESILTRCPAEQRIDRLVEAYLSACTTTPLDIDRMSSGLTSRVQQAVRLTVRDVSVQIAAAVARVWPDDARRPAPDAIGVEVMFLGMLGLASRYVHEGRASELARLRPGLRDLLARAWS